ncbi:MAG: Crp/Fnr family transcriptional regulator, partial [Catenulispora sp.]|nr:Crp/Fnr family transcriptional regulator [Catenulispora sp.]
AQVLRDGEVFGDVPLLIDRDPPYLPRAATSTTCLWLAAGDFLALLDERPALARIWLASCAARFFDSQARMLRMLDGPLPQRIAGLLIREAREGVVALPQATLAAMLGASRPSVNRILRTLEGQGLIGLRYRQVQVHDADGLSRMMHD